MILKIFEEGLMIEQFYDDLFNKLKNDDYVVKSLAKIIDQSQPPNTVENIKKINEYLISGLKYSLVKGMKRVMQIHQFTNTEIQKMIPDQQCADFDSWVVIGCPRSTDIDVIVFVRDTDHSNGQTKQLSASAMDRLFRELKDCGYDMTKKLDINPVYVDPTQKNITSSFKGGIETQNIINATWMHHKQQMHEMESGSSSCIYLPKALVLHPMVNIEITEHEINNKLRAFAKYVLDHAEDICIDYANFRPIKMIWYTESANRMICEMKNVLQWIEYKPCKIIGSNLCVKIWHDRYKALTMKLLQIMLIYIDHPMIYTKNELCESVDIIFETFDSNIKKRYKECAFWYLFRGTEGKFDPDFFPVLISKYCDFSDIFLSF